MQKPDPEIISKFIEYFLCHHSDLLDRKKLIVKVRQERYNGVRDETNKGDQNKIKLFSKEEFPQLLSGDNKKGNMNQGFYVIYPEHNQMLLEVRSRFTNL